MTNSIRDITEADVLLVTGSNTTEAHPVLSLQMKKAVRKCGAKLILIDPRHIELADFAHLHLRHQPGTDVALFNAMAHVIIARGWVNETFVAERTEAFAAFKQAVADWPPERAAILCGVPAADIVEAARLYAQAQNGMIFWAAEYPFILSTGWMLFHWHGGTLSRRSPGLDAIAPEAEVEISPADAAAYQIEEGDWVQVSSRRGQVVVKARITHRSPTGIVFMTFHFAEAATNLVTIDAVDPTAKIPEYKICAVHMEKICEATGLKRE